MRRVALKIAYIGTDFYGFQRQPNLPTVEGEILSALKEVGVVNDPDKCGFGIAGRTDRGVHALGNVFSILTEKRIIINQINDALPNNIKILAQAKVPIRFKVRYALNRHYSYLFITHPEIQGTKYINFEEMINASQIIEGKHNFINFSKRSERNPIRTIDSVEVQKDVDLIRVDVIGESFLWNMVRKIVTVLLMVGHGEIEVDKIYEYFKPQNEAPIKPMPPEGLILMDVNYADVKFIEDPYAQKSFISYLEKEFIKNQSIASSEIEMIKSIKNK
ncbi:MAG: tRNA pseudouridine(38-40) synthase TruA [Methanobacterium sp.]|nr:tRNA pseudouridine(38-40) synthase TruA [Methanobacterium sp.]